MVYCGKLSKACLPCRKRRLLCDLRKDGCSQCRRAHVACVGYQDTTAIRIRDETAAVQQKVTSRISAARSMIQSMDLPLCYRAKEIFYQNYVVDETRGYSFMKQYYSVAAQDEHLVKSVDAISLAYLNHQTRSENAQAEAQLQYVDALKLTGKALQSPELALKDSTMLSILLLDLYEKITNKDPQYDGAWAAHLKGAFSLAQLRGDKQYHKPDSLGMLVRLSTNILISCVVSERAIPEEVVALLAVITSPSAEQSDPSLKELELMVAYAHLNSQVKHNLLSDDEIIRAVLDLDTQLFNFLQQLTLSGHQKTVYVDEKSAHHYEAYHFVYTDEHVGQTWNVLRLTRILICELIFSRCPKSLIDSASDHSQSSLDDYAMATVYQMSCEICATVPQYIGASSDLFCKIATSTDLLPVVPVPDARISVTQQRNAKQYVTCYRLIFPLYVVAYSTPSSKSIKQYAIQQLHFMADHHGIENALTVANILGSGERRHPWSVYALLGSYAFVC